MLKLECGNSFCEIAPEIGANLFRLSLGGHEILHFPESTAELAERPEFYGFPVLFPPNRIDAGTFEFNGRVCRLPLNKPEENNHIHGLARKARWSIVSQDADSCVLSFVFDETAPEFAGYPFAFELRLEYALSPDRLDQTIRVFNGNDRVMPCGLGFHTAFLAPQRMRLECGGKRWEILPPRHLPTGRFIEFGDINPGDWFEPEKQYISMPFPMKRGMKTHLAELDCGTYGVLYKVDGKFTNWCLWNLRAGSGFICPEPMNILANEYNLKLPPAFASAYSLPAGETAVYRSSIELVRKT